MLSITPNLPSSAAFIVDTIAAAGGRPVLIGGAVRDRLLGLPLKDIDIEVYGLPMDALAAALRPAATVHAVGKSFGILKVNYRGAEIDVSLPRRERKAGHGHRGFDVQSDPFMPFSEAASRRDFTINAIGFDLILKQLLDPWHGIADLEQGIIRHITDAFDEDPLRVLRACQFAARFEFVIAPETLKKCRSLGGELQFLSRERIWEELKKLLLKSRRPSLGITALADTGAMLLFPELTSVYEAAGNSGCDQYNTVLDEAARRCRDGPSGDEDNLTLLLAALCWRFSALGDARCATESFLQRSGFPSLFLKTVPPLVVLAQRPFELWRKQGAAAVSEGDVRRLALQVPIRPLCLLAKAIASADPVLPQMAPLWLLDAATRLGVADTAPQPLLLGRHLLQLGVAPGLVYKDMLAAAFDAQLDGEFVNEEQGIVWLKSHLQRVCESENG
ncbi:MAG: CCA tRNA nucleotidyltransferase [Gammaproteobacteria bacterium]